MLRIGNNRLLLQSEIPAYGECITSSIPYLANSEEAENFFPNIKLKESIRLSECDHKTIALSIQQLVDFINQWHDKSPFMKLTQWSVNEWLKSYLHDNLLVAEYLGLTEICDSEAYFPDYVITSLKAIDLSKVKKQSYITIDVDMPPEFSWCVEDYLAHRLYGGKSRYKELIEEQLYDGYISAQQVEIAKKINHGESIESHISTDFDLDAIGINEKTIDLFCPCEDEFFHTNISHIRKTIQHYVAMGGK